MKIHLECKKAFPWSFFYPDEPSYFFLSAFAGTAALPCMFL